MTLSWVSVTPNSGAASNNLQKVALKIISKIMLNIHVNNVTKCSYIYTFLFILEKHVIKNGISIHNETGRTVPH